MRDPEVKKRSVLLSISVFQPIETYFSLMNSHVETKFYIAIDIDIFFCEFHLIRNFHLFSKVLLKDLLLIFLV